ncbi:MAG: thioredoxin family protein [Fimbriimonas ginsengisoli]|uniref:Thioredoxin family protein n=1 Tax=Fimbriimonas ginsengisoli TaxID=1005039 RepID=A0A931LSC7_FIMGI|nr:thioredoxin family protein [Fimbriimonas ginsengisoli]
MSRSFVFCKINGEQQPALMGKYSVPGFPTLVFMKPSGQVVHSFSGYRPLDRFLAEMETARQNAAK